MCINAKYPEINELIRIVEQRYGAKIKTTVDFNCLSAEISFATKRVISSSTLKRIWGYVDYNFTPRETTLDVLTKYVGFSDYVNFTETIKKRGCNTSMFITECKLDSLSINFDAKIKITWFPNRLVIFRNIGNNSFIVDKSVNSKLQEGDICEIDAFTKGHPLFISNIKRGESDLMGFIAGREKGLEEVSIIR
ncbi:MAG: hypothetical protein ACP5OJ_02610 [Methanothermobacter sp.]|jgi:hypothetical protein|nr:hypothetical protein [Bacteroidales bacterium]MBP9584355.1 hypothetical protein [Bacteroidales bacterium]MBP9978185.1 hypothetical protein [Bacteroidales bacterium]WRQ33018.1 hypothetical protein U5907_10620 [Bacteroidales bacterium MB20-C3-3]